MSTRNIDQPGLALYGVKEYTPLYTIPRPFSVVWSVPVEQFHLLYEGLAKMFIVRLFIDSAPSESRDIFAEWNQMTAVFSETPRRARKITGQMKGAEYAVMSFTAFPTLVLLMQDRDADYWFVENSMLIPSFLNFSSPLGLTHRRSLRYLLPDPGL